MRRASRIGILGIQCILCILAASSSAEPASAAPSAELKVSLFGQPCVLQGPVDAKILKAIHSLSPEQLYPERGPTLLADPTRRALDKLKATPVPSALDRYRERLTRRLEAQAVLLDSLESFRKTHKPAPVLAIARKYLAGKQLKEFESALKRAEPVKDLASERGRDVLDVVFDAFSERIEADPEEEFHRAIHRMQVQYTCSFEENGAGGREE